MRRAVGRREPPWLAPDPDVDVALHVAAHEAKRRASLMVTPIDMLYGLLQAEPFAAAIERVGGDPAAITDRIATVLEEPMERFVWRVHSDFELTVRQQPAYIGDDGAVALFSTRLLAHRYRRGVTVVDLWSCLSRTGAGTALEEAGVDPYDLLFWMVHGAPAQDTARITAPEVDIMVRNDDYTELELVERILGGFGIAAPAARELALQIHHDGAAIVTRLPLAGARQDIAAIRGLARGFGQPLWIGIDDRPQSPYR